MSHTVTLMPSGHTFVAPIDQPVLTAGLAAGQALAYSCRQGVCGTCRGRLLQGSVDRGDEAFAAGAGEPLKSDEILLCQARARSDLVIEAEVIEGLSAFKARITPCRVTEIQRPSRDVGILRVRMHVNEGVRFAAGQYVEFGFPDGRRRIFSIATPPRAEGAAHLEFHLKNLPGGFGGYVHEGMAPGEVLWFEGPLGTFFVRDGAAPLIFCATGTGYAPIKAMLGSLFAGNSHADRPINFYWGSRSADGLYDLDALRSWAGEHPNFQFHPVLSSGLDPTVPGARSGYVQDAVLSDFPNLAGHEVYACGSPEMIQAARAAFVQRGGLPNSKFHFDEFVPASAAPVTPVPVTPLMESAK